MIKFIVSIFAAIVLIGTAYKYYEQRGTSFGLDRLPFFKGSIQITSKDFTDGDILPVKFTCDGENVNPQFSIANVPAETKSLAIILEDVSTPSKPFTHWLLVNLDPKTKLIDNVRISGNGLTGVNDMGKFGYSGPCPQLGETHKYYFKVYALNESFEKSSFGRGQFEKMIDSHVLATGRMLTVYSKSP